MVHGTWRIAEIWEFNLPKPDGQNRIKAQKFFTSCISSINKNRIDKNEIFKKEKKIIEGLKTV